MTFFFLRSTENSDKRRPNWHDDLFSLISLVIFFRTIAYRSTMKVLGQGLKDALEPQNDGRYSQSGAMFRLVKHSFSNLRSKLLTDDVIKNVCNVITLI